MTRDVERLILQEMQEDENMELRDIGTFKEAEDHDMGFDPTTGEVDPDAGLIFPQPITNYDE